MLVTLGWLLLAGLPLVRPAAHRDPLPPADERAGRRVTVWTDRDEPYARGDGARVHLSVDEPSHVAVFRVDTDGGIQVLFPGEPWADSFVRDGLEVDRSFSVDDDPGVGYVFAIAASAPFDFRLITRGDYWDYRLIDGGRIQGDPYVALTDLASRLVPEGDYDYDVTPYYVGHRYDYPRFVCYDCHAYASYEEWNPYRASCTRYRVVVRDDPRYYPYRYGGRNVVAERPAHPGPRFVFRDTQSGRTAVTRGQPERRRWAGNGDVGRTSEDHGERGAVAAPPLPPLRRHERAPEPERLAEPPLLDEGRNDRHRRGDRGDATRKRRGDDGAREAPPGHQPPTPAPRSTGEPELKRRRP